MLLVDIRFLYIWRVINKNCDNEKISDELCARCNDNSPVACYADMTACNAGETDACPYNICRKGLLNFFVDKIK